MFSYAKDKRDQHRLAAKISKPSCDNDDSHFLSAVAKHSVVASFIATQTSAPACNKSGLAESENSSTVPPTLRRGPHNEQIDVVKIEDYLPNCVDNYDVQRKMYRRRKGIQRGWNDTDLFYADGEGELVPITTAMVDAYWDPKYSGFSHTSDPDWTRNCEDFATESGRGEELGTYSNINDLYRLLSVDGQYVLHLGYHWMRLERSGSNIIIRQKDGESRVYCGQFSVPEAIRYIIEKSSEGKVFLL